MLPTPPACDDCSACRQEHTHELPKPVEGGLTGWALAAATATVFLLPLGLAILGAGLAGGSAERQVFGALTGLAVGIGLAVLITRLFGRRGRKEGL